MRALSTGQELEVVDQYKAGKATSVLCSDFGVSDTTVRNILRRNSVIPSRSPAQNQLDSVELYDAFRLYFGGMNTHQAGEEMGRSRRGVLLTLKRAGFRLRERVKRRALAPDQEDELAGLYEAGATFSALETRFEVSNSVVKRVLHDHGVIPRTGWGRYRTDPWTDRNGVQHVFKSSWELAYAKYLDDEGADWKYEPFKVYLKKSRCYTPDFGVYRDGELAELVEVKGWVDQKVERRIMEFVKTYPQLPLRILGPLEMVRMGLVGEKYADHPMAGEVFRIQQKVAQAA